MHTYTAPVADMRFVLREIAALDHLATFDRFGEVSEDLVSAILEEGAKITGELLAPLNWSGDQQGCSLENGVVRTPDGFKEAYTALVEGGWGSLPFDPEYGGQGLPWVVQTAFSEMLNSANMALALAPLLTQGGIDAIDEHGSEALKAAYLPKLITGEWNGTMNLTEPQAGTDVGALKTRAIQAADGTYRITGQKIYITWGENDCAANTIHLVLARLPDAPQGTKGISLFVVPKFLINEDGSLGARNDLRCSGLEEKLGIHGSPTCVMSYGDNEGAVGYLLGREGAGMAAMFTMMNNARLAVGLQGLAIAERAYQAAVIYANDRVQSAPLDGSTKQGVAIIGHPDVRRNLMLMKSQIFAMRGLIYHALGLQDRARASDDVEERQQAQTEVDLLTPVVKAWCTDKAVELASIGVQIHGGMGFVEETGAAQYYRDARILPIYEGTNGVQALDLMGRKTLRDGGKATDAFIANMRLTATELAKVDEVSAARLSKGIDALAAGKDWLLATGNIETSAAGATAYLELFATVAGGWVMAKRMLAAKTDDERAEQTPAALFYLSTLLPRADSLLESLAGNEVVNRVDSGYF